MVILFGILLFALFLAYLQLKYSMSHGPTTTALLAKARQNQTLLEKARQNQAHQNHAHQNALEL